MIPAVGTPFLSINNTPCYMLQVCPINPEERNGGKERGIGRERMESEMPRWQEVSALWLSARENDGKGDEAGVTFEASRERKRARDKSQFAVRQDS